MTVTAGNYVVTHGAYGALCPSSGALPGVPCASQIVIGCPTKVDCPRTAVRER